MDFLNLNWQHIGNKSMLFVNIEKPGSFHQVLSPSEGHGLQKMVFSIDASLCYLICNQQIVLLKSWKTFISFLSSHPLKLDIFIVTGILSFEL